MGKKYICKLRRGVKDDKTGRNDWVSLLEKQDIPEQFRIPQDGELVLEDDNGVPRLKIGDGKKPFAELPYMSVDSFLFSKVATITLEGGDAWIPVPDFEGRYTQDITEQIKDKITECSKIDIQPTPEQLCVFHEKDVTFTTVNENGRVRVCAIGIKPEGTYEDICVTISEVAESGVIIGNTTATPNPQSDWEQTDDKKADYIKNKPEIVAGEGENSIVEGNQTQALSLNAVASGFGSIAGGRGFKILSQGPLNDGNGYYELSSIDGIQELLDAGETLTYCVRLSSVLYARGIILNTYTEARENGDIYREVEVSNWEWMAPKDEGDFNSPDEEGYNSDEKPTVANYFTIVGHPELGDRDVGFNAVAFGENTMATDRSAVAFGRDTKAIGEFSVAEGYGTMAIYAGHSEGKYTKALGETSHSEGYKSEAHGHKSHAEGCATKSIGDASHAEGYSYAADGSKFPRDLEAKGYASHAEGGASQTSASAHYAHAEGYLTNANGEGSHTEGSDTTANNKYAHAEGGGTTAGGEAAHSEGIGTNAIGYASHTEGCGSKAHETAYASHTEGYYTTTGGDADEPSSGYGTNSTSGSYAHAEGNYTIANGVAAHSEGRQTLAKGNYSHTEGFNTVTKGESSHAEGSGTKAFQPSAHAEGMATQAKATGSHTEGRATVTKGDFAHAEGSSYLNQNFVREATAQGYASHVEGIGGVTIGIAAHAGGFQTTAQGNYSHAGGYMTVAEGTATTALGENTRATIEAQTVVGKYNEEDNTALFVVGVGKSAKDLSNAFTAGNNGTDDYITIGGEELTKGQLIAIKEGLVDIEAALDSIIAIQEALIPKPTITFSIDGVEYTAKEGMTWGEWIESEYNTIGATNGDCNGDFVGLIYVGILAIVNNRTWTGAEVGEAIDKDGSYRLI